MFFRKRTPAPACEAVADAAQVSPVTDLVDLLGGLPTEIAERILVVDATGHGPDQHLGIAAATRQAAQVLADAMGLTDPPTTTPSPFLRDNDTETTWTGRTARGHHVEILHDDAYDDAHPQDAHALIGHLTRLDEALRADPAAAAHLTRATATTRALRVDTRTTPAARDLAATLCPQAPGDTVETPTQGVPLEHWAAHSQDTTVSGPSTVPHETHHHEHDTTDTADDDTYYC